ncbi:MAG: DUF4962 domain-containing protein [Bacteroidota bacterium]
MKNFFQLVLLLLLVGCGGDYQATEPETQTIKLPVIYPKIRIWNTPSAGEKAVYNPPGFQWPSSEKGNYSIRISTSKSFDKDLIEKNGIPYALFNPHQSLKEGLWYWQYRVDNKVWTEIDSFNISGATPSFVTPDWDALLSVIPNTHPRVLIVESELEDFRQRVEGYEEVSALIKEADEYVGKSPPDESLALPTFSGKNEFENNKIALLASKWVGWNVYQVMTLLSKAYLLTGDQKYFQTAKTWMVKIAKWDPEGPTHRNNFGDSGIMAGLAVGIDSFWALLTEEERKPIIDQITARAKGFYHLWLNSVESRSSSMHVWQHILHRMFYTSLALVREVPEASAWLEYIYELWIAQSPKMGEKDGAWFNGVSYFEMNTLTLYDISLTLQELTGTNFMQSPWYTNNPKWLIYAFPPGSISDGFCNNGSLYEQPTLNYAGYTEAAARMFDDSHASWYAKEVSKKLGEAVEDDQEFRWHRIKRKHLNPLPTPVKDFDLPQAAIFPDVGVAYMHTSIQDINSNLMLSVRSSPYGPMAHTHADQNTFNIAYGGKKLFYNTGYRPAMGDPHYLGWFKHTQGHNGILIDGQGQPFDAGAYGWLPRFLHSEQISYVVGDASNAYSGIKEEKMDSGLKVFRRHYLMVRPDVIIIYDELEADHAAEWSWLLHNDMGFKVDRYEILAESEVTRAKISLFSSSAVEIQVTDQFSVPVDNWTNKVDEDGDTLTFENQWHLKAVSEQKVEKMRYLAIFQIKADGSFEQVEESSNSYKVDNWIIEASLDINKPAAIKLRNTDNTVAFCSEGYLEVVDINPKYSVSAKLYELINGRSYFQESIDMIPEAIQKVMDRESLIEAKK